MSIDFASRLRRSTSIIVFIIALNCAPVIQAQVSGWHAPPGHMLPLVGEEGDAAAPTAAATPSPAPRPQVDASRRGPLARLIENPDQTSGTPPYALTDQTGTIQRYVEPVPGVDLAAHLGQVVVVRNDTGPTLLATQLELPRERLYPLVASGDRGSFGPPRKMSFQPPRPYMMDSRVAPVQYVDNDDSSVQLLPDNMSMSGGMPPGQGGVGQLPLIGDGNPGYPYPGMPGQMCGPTCGPQCCDQQCCDPMQCNPGMMQPYVGPMVGACPQCGGYHNSPGCPQQPCAATAGACENQGMQVSGDVEFMFYRVHMDEDVVGKLSETYQFTPRFILNFRNVGNLDARIRYWTYERDTQLLSGSGSIRFEFNVLDIEAVHRFEGRRSQLALSAGLRLADIQLIDNTDQQSGSNMIGLTMAADGLTPLVCMQGGYCGWVYGGRVSLLGGNWGGDDNSVFINQRFRDDNILVTELYAGAEIARKCRNLTVRGRAVYEIQNWRSDVLAQDAGIESIGFFGPALQLGLDF